MISRRGIEFYDDWTAKANAIAGDNLSSIYDRFITNFIIYNSLYNEVPMQLSARGFTLPRRLYDDLKATDYVVKYITPNTFLKKLSEKGCDKPIDQLVKLIDDEKFYIELSSTGERQRAKDIRIASHIKSKNKNNKAVNILKIIYHVRCNIFHGNKQFKEYQRELLTPATKVLQEVNTILFEHIREN